MADRQTQDLQTEEVGHYLNIELHVHANHIVIFVLANHCDCLRYSKWRC